MIFKACSFQLDKSSDNMEIKMIRSSEFFAAAKRQPIMSGSDSTRKSNADFDVCILAGGCTLISPRFSRKQRAAK